MSASDREILRLAFLKAAGLSDAARAPLPGDASTRRYERLTMPDGATLMLMDQAPAAESPPADPSWTADQRRAAGWNAIARLSAGRIEAFAAVAAHLKTLGLSAPAIPALDAPNGLAVLEDFGDALFARVIEDGADGRLIRLAPRAFGETSADGDVVTAGAAALDKRVAETAAAANIGGMEFFFGIPGTIGGALRMNAGANGGDRKSVV